MSLYEGDMSSRLIAGEKMEDVLKKPDAPKINWADLSKNLLNNQGFPDTYKTKPYVEQQPVIKELQSKEQVKKQIDEEIAKIKFPLKSTLITSAVPLGLAYYSYYNNYSLTKGIGVVVIGSVVAWFGAITISGGKFV